MLKEKLRQRGVVMDALSVGVEDADTETHRFLLHVEPLSRLRRVCISLSHARSECIG